MDGQAVATWIQAIGSAGSLLAFAAWVGIAVINRKDDQVLRFERQAQTVAAWVDKGTDHGSEDNYVICVVNGGEAPVYHCEVTLPGLVERDEPGSAILHLVPPHMTRTVPTPEDVTALSWKDIYSSGVAPELRFTDSSGRRWNRDGNGVLSQL
jgi:hypothetical protein